MRWLLVIGILCTNTFSFSQDNVDLYSIGSSLREGFNSILQHNNEYYALGNATNSVNNSSDFYLVKLDQNFNLIWSKYIGLDGDENGKKIILTNDGNLLLVGNTNAFQWVSYDFYVVKIDTSGTILWDNHYGGENWDFGNDAVSIGNSYLIGGETYSFGNGDSDGYLIKINENGTLVWDTIFGDSKTDNIMCMNYSNQTVAISGCYTLNSKDSSDAFLLLLNENLESTFFQLYGGNGDEQINDIAQVDDLGYVMVGYSRSFGYGDKDIYFLKTNSTGSELFYRVYGIDVPGNNKDDEARSVCKYNNNGFLVTGYTITFSSGEQDIFATVSDNNGISQPTSLTFGAFNEDIGNEIINYNSTGWLIAGNTYSYGNGLNDGFIVIRDSVTSTLDTQNDFITISDSNFAIVQSQINLSDEPLRIYPNPTYNSIYLQNGKSEIFQYTIQDLQGIIVEKGFISNSISLTNLKSGVYFISIYSVSNLIFQNKIIKLD